MIVELNDRHIVRWAVDNSAPWYYTKEPGLPEPCLKLHCGHVTAYFCQGRLLRLMAQADHGAMDEMFAQLMGVFGLCGHRQPDELVINEDWIESHCDYNDRMPQQRFGPS